MSVSTTPKVATRVLVVAAFRVQGWMRPYIEAGQLRYSKTVRCGQQVGVLEVTRGQLIVNKASIRWRDPMFETGARVLLGDLSRFYEVQDSRENCMQRSRRLCRRCYKLSGVLRRGRVRVFVCSECDAQTYPIERS